MFKQKIKEPIPWTYSPGDTYVVDIFDNMIDRYNSTIETFGGIKFNQGTIVTMIVAYLMSTYVDDNSGDIRFFNEMRKVKETFERKTHLKFSEHLLEIADKPLNYLLSAAKKEFSDDYNMEQYQIDKTDSFAKFGTAVTKTVHRKGRNIVKIVPWETFLCDPVNGKDLPAGEVTSSTLQKVLDDERFDDTTKKRIKNYLYARSEDNFDPSRMAVMLYEVHGQLPNNIFDIDKKGTSNGMFIIMVTEDDDKFVLYKGRTSNVVYHIETINPMFGRTMGYGPMEAMLESQIMTNDLGNMTLDHVRAASKIFYQTADQELDGTDLQAIDNLVLINHESESPITQVSASPTGYGAMSSFMNTVVSMGRESAAIQDASLGRGPKSNTSFAAIQAAAVEADGVYSSIRDKIFNLGRPLFKKKGGFIDMIVDYFESGKDIEELLTPFEQKGFRKFIARKKANIEIQKQQDEEFEFIDGLDEVADFILKKDSGKRYSIEFKDGDIDREFIRDKTRLTYIEKDSILLNRLASLERTRDVVMQNPEAYPTFNLSDIQTEIMELMDIASATNISVPLNQSGQISPTPTGPGVAMDAGLTG